MSRNVILSTGTSSAGKSKATIAEVNLLGRKLGFEIEHMSDLPRVTAAQLIGLEEPILTCQNLGLPLLISDEECIKAAIILDHLRTYGIHHTHPVDSISELGFSTLENSGKHTHTVLDGNLLPTFPFTVINRYVSDLTAELFWHAIVNVPADGIIIAETARGKNGHPPDSELASVDFSYERLHRKFIGDDFPIEERLPIEALMRIRACVWVRASLDARLYRATTYRQFRDETITRFFAEDDFHHFRPLLEAHRIPILPIDNDIDQEHKEIQTHLEGELVRKGYLDVTKFLLDELKETRAEMRAEIPLLTRPLTKEAVW